MKSINESRINEGLIFFLSKEGHADDKINEMLEKSVIVINLFYESTLEFYFEYINNLPDNIDVCIISSKDEVLAKSKIFNTHKRTTYYHKQNRGRDYSAIFVELRDVIRKYDYFCFLHDKKELEQIDDSYSSEGIYTIDNLWGNMIATKGYIYNVMELFSKHPDIGIMLPPERIGDYCGLWYRDVWGEASNYELCRMLISKFHFSIELSKEVSPLLATSFWVKTKTIEKLLSYEWKYEDFPDEPMPLDGTISHALERLIPYTPKDYGMKASTVMNEAFAVWLYNYLQTNLRKLFGTVWDEGIYTINHLISREQRKERLIDFAKNHKTLYVYGAGEYGKGMINTLESAGINIEAILVSNGYKNDDRLGKYPIYEVSELGSRDKEGVIIAVSSSLRRTFEENIKKQGKIDYIYGF